jgi:hypothetical protein
MTATAALVRKETALAKPTVNQKQPLKGKNLSHPSKLT